jgi:hypothetical protein
MLSKNFSEKNIQMTCFNKYVKDGAMIARFSLQIKQYGLRIIRIATGLSTFIHH